MERSLDLKGVHRCRLSPRAKAPYIPLPPRRREQPKISARLIQVDDDDDDKVEGRKQRRDERRSENGGEKVGTSLPSRRFCFLVDLNRVPERLDRYVCHLSLSLFSSSFSAVARGGGQSCRGRGTRLPRRVPFPTE